MFLIVSMFGAGACVASFLFCRSVCIPCNNNGLCFVYVLVVTVFSDAL